MKKFILLLWVMALLTLSACSSADSARSGGGYDSDKISKIVGVDVSEAEYMTVIDTHGGFHRDGKACVIIPFEDDSCENAVSGNEFWHELPLSDNLMKIVYGTVEDGHYVAPYITFDDDNTPCISYVEEGYYFFLDRHSQSKNPYIDSEIFDRSSYNLTVAIYDTQSNTLYYLELDT